MARTPSNMLALGTKACEFELTDTISGQKKKTLAYRAIAQPFFILSVITVHSFYIRLKNWSILLKYMMILAFHLSLFRQMM